MQSIILLVIYIAVWGLHLRTTAKTVLDARQHLCRLWHNYDISRCWHSGLRWDGDNRYYHDEYADFYNTYHYAAAKLNAFALCSLFAYFPAILLALFLPYASIACLVVGAFYINLYVNPPDIENRDWLRDRNAKKTKSLRSPGWRKDHQRLKIATCRWLLGYLRPTREEHEAELRHLAAIVRDVK